MAIFPLYFTVQKLHPYPPKNLTMNPIVDLITNFILSIVDLSRRGISSLYSSTTTRNSTSFDSGFSTSSVWEFPIQFYGPWSQASIKKERGEGDCLPLRFLKVSLLVFQFKKIPPTQIQKHTFSLILLSKKKKKWRKFVTPFQTSP